MSNSFAALDDVKEDVPIKQEETAKPLVNTSLPAKQAPVLAPATLASLTSNGAPPRPFSFSPPGLEIKAPIFKQEHAKQKQKPLEPADFPALGSKKPTSIALVQKTSFSELSKEWAKKQKDDEMKLKEEKEKEALTQRVLNKQKDDEENARKMGIVRVPMHILSKKLDPEEEAMRKREMEEENYDDEESMFESVRAEYVEEEEEDEYECDGNWNQRKHRDELY